jgi:uncharacterized membrane protein
MKRAILLEQWDRVRGSFWFVPSLMAAGAAGLAFVTLALDRASVGGWSAPRASS